MYQASAYDKKNGIMHIWDDELGHHTFSFKPYGYLPDPNGQYKSLSGTRLKRVNSNLKNNPDSYESDLNEEVRMLIDLYYESDEPSKGHRVLVFDIETAKDENGYSTIHDVRTSITSIAYYDKSGNDRRVLLLDERERIKESVLNGDGYTIEIFRTERDLLTRFINAFAEIAPTIITGWNTDKYDIPYLLKRCKKVLGAKSINLMSSAGIVDYNPKSGKWKIFGVSSLDYLRLYKNFTYTELPNYRLDTVGKFELGSGKVEYDGDLDTLFEQDIYKFAWYNMTDVDIVSDLDEKLQLINLARTICHKGHVPYEDVYFSSKYLDGAAIVDLKRNGFVAPNKKFRFIEEEKQDDLAGAYVMPPVPGLYKWVYDLDLTSLYPSIIMSLNISPETKIAVIQNWDENCLLKDEPVSVVLNTGFPVDDVKKWLRDNNYTVASNGTVYETSKRGFLPTILEKWFSERVKFKSKRDEFEVGSEEYKFYDALQLTQKVLLNSFYGVLGLKTFRFHDLDNAGAITATGQSVIKFSAMAINKYYGNEIGQDYFINATGQKCEYSFYTDTDSTFVSSLPLIKKRYPDFDETDEQFMIEKTNEIASEIQKYINNLYDVYADRFHNTDTHRFQIKQEYVAKSGLWIAKKRYAQWVIFKEGKPTDKLDIKGLDVVRSSFPTDFKQIMTKALWLILKEHGKQETADIILDFKKNIHKSDILNVMKNTGVKEISKYTQNRKPFTGYLSGTPIHVKSSINFNDLLSKLDQKEIVDITNGEKIKWAYLKNNPYGFDSIALRGYEDPKEIVDFVEKYIDRDKIFDRELRGKFDDFFAAMNWGKLPENNNIGKFFNF